MNSSRNTFQPAKEFNQKTFQAKAVRRKQAARLPFETKLEIVEELNALIRDFAANRNKNRAAH